MNPRRNPMIDEVPLSEDVLRRMRESGL